MREITIIVKATRHDIEQEFPMKFMIKDLSDIHTAHRAAEEFMQKLEKEGVWQGIRKTVQRGVTKRIRRF